MVNTSSSTLTKAEEASKDNKATTVILLRRNNPTMTNVSVAKTAGCSQTYSSKIWSDYMKVTGKATKTRHKTNSASAAPTKPKKRILAKRATTMSTSAAAPSTEQILNARNAMQGIIHSVGECAAKNILSDVMAK